MAAQTPNRRLNKPDFSDPASIITAVADNMDILDEYDPADRISYSNSDMPGVTNVEQGLDALSANKVNKQTYISGGSLNDITTPGSYSVTTAVTETPEAANYSVYVTRAGNNDPKYVQQLLINADGRIYLRVSFNGNWRDTVRIQTVSLT